MLDLAAALVVQLAGFLGQTFRGHAPGGHQDVGVVVALVAVLAGSMDANVNGHAVTLHQRTAKLACQPLAFACR